MIDLHFLQSVCDVVKTAGAIIERIANEGFETDYKQEMDPVTTADHAANAYLHEHLLNLLPSSGWLSEETKDSGERLTKDYVWIVDPIDGTREFVAHVPHYAVSVALWEHGRIILGVVYNPVLHECFSALRDKGAWFNGASMKSVNPRNERLLVLGSRSEIKRGEFMPFDKVFDIEAVGSIAYKLALIAAGRANATFSLGQKNEWDIAAGVVLVEMAGGRVTDQDGVPFVFNQSNTLVNGVLAATSGDYSHVFSLIHQF